MQRTCQHPSQMSLEEINDFRKGACLPKTATNLALLDGDNDYAVWFCHIKGNPVAVGFKGRSLKRSFGLRFRNEAERIQYVDKFITVIKLHKQQVAERRRERNQPHKLEVGDVLVSTWGYDQTNVDFYEVTKLVGKTQVMIRPIAGRWRDTGCNYGSVVPEPGHFIGDEMRRKVNARFNSVSIKSFASARKLSYKLVDGKRVYKDTSWSNYH